MPWSSGISASSPEYTSAVHLLQIGPTYALGHAGATATHLLLDLALDGLDRVRFLDSELNLRAIGPVFAEDVRIVPTSLPVNVLTCQRSKQTRTNRGGRAL
jgi:hypothetical protein